MYPGQTFNELINQGQRECVVIAVDGAKFLYEYEMPNGTSAIRNQEGNAVSYNAIPRFWIRLIEDQFGLHNLIANPQQGRKRGAGLLEKLKAKLAAKEERDK